MQRMSASFQISNRAERCGHAYIEARVSGARHVCGAWASASMLCACACCARACQRSRMRVRVREGVVCVFSAHEAHLLGACELSRPIPGLACTQARASLQVDRVVAAHAVAAHLRSTADTRARDRCHRSRCPAMPP